MFLRIYGYSMLCSIRQGSILFWTLLFPIILGTLFTVSFGDLNDTENMFHQIPVAYVEGEAPQTAFWEVLEELETESELVQITAATQDEAKKLLEAGEVTGIFTNDTEITLTVMEEGTAVSILESIQEQYEQLVRALTAVAAAHPENLETAVESISGEWSYLSENSITEQDMDMTQDFFYSLIAMNCLFSCYAGFSCAMQYKASLSSLAARRLIAGTKRLPVLLTEIFAKITVQFLCTLVSVTYLKYAMDVNLSEDAGRILLILLLGNSLGVMLGVFMGSIGQLSANVKISICMGVSMFLCFLSGLMVNGIYQWVETHTPIVNRINPAALIVKAFYSLNIYETNTRYCQCLFSLLIIAVLLGVGSYLMVRRERYASL